MNTLSLWFRGEQHNSTEPLYIALRDDARHVKIVNHPDPNALRATEWQQWLISLATFTPDEMDMSALKRMCIGVGDRQKPEPGGAGTIYIDDITLTKRPHDNNE